MLNTFGTQSLTINISDDISSRNAGVMGDLNTRSIRFTVLAENGEVLNDSDVIVKLVCKTESNELIFTDGEYLRDGVYSVFFPNEVFENEQDLECMIRLEKDSELIHSNVFIRHVVKGLVGTTREGKTTIIDLVKVMAFADKFVERMQELKDTADEKLRIYNENDRAKTDAYNVNDADKTSLYNQNHEAKMKAYNDNDKEKKDIYNLNDAEKTSIYNQNHKSKMNIYNANHDEKMSIYNTNDSAKTDAYNANHETRLNEYDENAENKLSDVNAVATRVEGMQTDINQSKAHIDEVKGNIDTSKGDFDSKYNKVLGILDAEQGRVNAEEERRQHDERIQRIINEGLDSELGEYAKKTEVSSLVNDTIGDISSVIELYSDSEENTIKDYFDRTVGKINDVDNKLDEIELTDKRVRVTTQEDKTLDVVIGELKNETNLTNNKIGDLNNLVTKNKDNLVNAINETAKTDNVKTTKKNIFYNVVGPLYKAASISLDKSISGDIVDIIRSDDNLAAVATTDGYWLVGSTGTATKVNGITGNIIAITGKHPLKSRFGSAIATTDGYWLVGSTGTATKVNGITGDIIAITGEYPTDLGYGTAVATTDGYWIVGDPGKVTKVNGITGDIIAILGANPLNSSGSAVATTDGYWIVNNTGTATKVNGITGDIIAITGDYPLNSSGSAVATTDGYWLVTNSNNVTKVNGITEDIIAITGEYPLYSGYGTAVATTDGYWLVDNTGKVTKVNGITGDIITITGESPLNSSGSAVATTDGYWIVDSTGTATKVNGITGDIIAITGDYPLNRGINIAITLTSATYSDSIINSKDKISTISIWTGTKAEYDAITTKDSSVLYIIS